MTKKAPPLRYHLVLVWATADQLCERYQISRTTWWRWAKTKGFPVPVRFGRAARWYLKALEKYLTCKKTKTGVRKV